MSGEREPDGTEQEFILILVITTLFTLALVAGCASQPSPRYYNQNDLKFGSGDIITNDTHTTCVAYYVDRYRMPDWYILREMTRCDPGTNGSWEWTGGITGKKIPEIENGDWTLIGHVHSMNVTGPYRTLT